MLTRFFQDIAISNEIAESVYFVVFGLVFMHYITQILEFSQNSYIISQCALCDVKIGVNCYAKI